MNRDSNTIDMNENLNELEGEDEPYSAKGNQTQKIRSQTYNENVPSTRKSKISNRSSKLGGKPKSKF